MKPFYKEKYPHLFSPMFIGKKKLEFKHRILTSPMGSAVGTMDFQGRINDAGVDYYTQFARGGFASVTVPIEIPANGGHAFALSLDESAGGYAFMHNMQRSVHMFRTRTLCELYHAGCCMLPGPGRTVMSASAFTYNGHPVKEMDEKDMEDVARLYADAEFLAKRANFDGICLHYGHGWLMNNFLSPLSNHRTDQYGGPVENRVRFPRRVIERVREAIGDDMIIELRMNGSDRMEGGITPEDAARQALLFEDLVDMIHVSCGTRLDASGRPKMHPTCFVPDAHNADASEALKKAGVKVPVGVVGNVHDPDLAERLLAEGKADYILMARQAIADSDWVNKVRENRVEDIRPCIRCDYCIDGGRRGSLTTEVNIRKDATFDCHCSVNPLFRQGAHKPRALRPTSKKRVAVIGGGISGMQAALSAALGEFALCRGLMEAEMLENALLYPARTVELQMGSANIMSVRVPRIEARAGETVLSYGLAQTTAQLDGAIASLAAVFPDMIRLAELEKTCNMLADEIEKTRRRVNALEYVMIPDLQETIRYITMKLEENERGSLTRLMKVKDMMAAREGQ